jgi:two-component system, cell cycle sensor histidine kinase and response regulator CckA
MVGERGMSETMVTVLVIEDEDSHVELIRRALIEPASRAARYRLVVARGLREAREALESLRPDIVITDLNLPDGQAMELFGAASAGRAYPVIAMTSHGNEQTAIDALKAGVQEYVVKSAAALMGIPRTIEQVLREWGSIIERRRAEETLRDSERRLTDVINFLPDPTFAIDLQGRITIWNQAAEKFTGALTRDMVGKGDHEYALPFYGERRPILIDQVLAPSKDAASLYAPYRLEGGKVLAEAHLTSMKRGDTYLEGAAAPLYNSEGVVIGAIETVHDITARTKVERALQASEERYRRFFEQDLTADFIASSEGTVTMCNPAYLRLFGFASAAEATSIGLSELFPAPADFTAFLRLLQDGGSLAYHEMRMRRRDGTPLYVVANAILAREGDEEAATIRGYLFDETPRKALEQQLVQAQKMDAIGKLAGGVAHDINNMLSVILGFAEMSRQGLMPADPLYEYIQSIINAANRSADITRQLLTFARRQPVTPRVINLNTALESITTMLGRLIGENVELVLRPTRDLWNILIDASQADQIITNLATNARDAIEDVGTVFIETANVEIDEAYCTGHIDASPGQYVRLTVSDTGVGMDKGTLEHIFEPFFTTKKEGKGTGLGLATVYGVVTQNNGFIHVYSEPGEGTTFRIYFPRHGGEAARAERPRPVKSAGGTETILVVEDEKGILELVRKSLETQGYRVITANAPGEALLACEMNPEPIHLLLTDVVMPRMNGRELQERITGLRPGIKVIFMSGYTTDVIAHRGILEEGVNLIHKPFTPASLAQKIREVLDG